ncbi:MAG: thioredoxin family protein [Pirellulales bacterium]|nr:thioredoxin family protein [Pirellulales bacterium]
MDFSTHFERGLKYSDFLERQASPGDLRQWSKFSSETVLTSDQAQNLKSFQREMKVLCLAGTWCPDCASQCPVMEKFAQVCPLIDLRFLDRDEFSAHGGSLTLCGGQRVPTTIFLSEDGYFCGVFGDRSLSRYRNLAGRPLGLPEGMTLHQAIIQEWLNEFERIQLMLETSPRLQNLNRR